MTSKQNILELFPKSSIVEYDGGIVWISGPPNFMLMGFKPYQKLEIWELVWIELEKLIIKKLEE